MSNTPVGTDLLQSLQIFSELVIEIVCEELRVFSINDILLSVEEPIGDFVLGGVLEDGDNTFEFFSRKFTCSANIRN